SNQKILANFVRACYLLVSRIVDKNGLNKAHSQLLKVSQLIEDNYGTLYAFWYYSFERMNGVL
ncbi:18904_t:CDS:2, partial [Funneliformis geosporum]